MSNEHAPTVGARGGLSAGGGFYYDTTSNSLQWGAGVGGMRGTYEPNTMFFDTVSLSTAWTRGAASMGANQWSSLAQAVTGSGSWTFIWNAEVGGAFGGNLFDNETNDLGGLDLDSLYAQLNGGSITVTYEYDASSTPVPGPAAGLAVAAIGLVRRRGRG